MFLNVLSADPIALIGLSCVTSVGEDIPSPAEIFFVQRWGDAQGGGPPLLRGKSKGNGRRSYGSTELEKEGLWILV